MSTDAKAHDAYRVETTRLLDTILGFYARATEALCQVDPERFEALLRERDRLLWLLREASAGGYDGRAQEPWLQALAARVRGAERDFEMALERQLRSSFEQVRHAGATKRARRAYHTASR